MKIFRRENGKEVAYIQGKDIVLISKMDDLFKMFATNESILSIILSNGHQFIKIENKIAIQHLKNMDFIIDYDEYSKLSEEELYERLQENKLQLDRLLFTIKKKKRKNSEAIKDAYMTRNNYAFDVTKCITYKLSKSSPKYKIS